MQDYDKSSKWLIQHRGASLLRLGGVRDLVEWRPLQAEFVQSRRPPDGLIEARRQGQEKPDLFLLEISAYPYARLSDQMIDDIAAVRLDRRVLLLLSLRYNKDVTLLERLRALLGGREVMIESPLYREVVAEAERKGAAEGKRETILDVLVTRFGPIAQDLEVELKAAEYDRLRDLARFAAKCRSLASFRKHLTS